jgi:hypothetical protein
MSTLREVYECIIAKLPGPRIPSCRTFVEWNLFGRKFSHLAEGGTVYLLLIVAGLDLGWSLAKAHGRVVWEVGKLLREPDNTGEPQITT